MVRLCFHLAGLKALNLGFCFENGKRSLYRGRIRPFLCPCGVHSNILVYLYQGISQQRCNRQPSRITSLSGNHFITLEHEIKSLDIVKETR